MVFTVSALFTGSLAGRLKRQVEFMRATQARTETLYDFARKIASATATDDVLWAAAAHIAHTLECHSLILMPGPSGTLDQVQGFPAIEENFDPHSQAAALWAFQKNQPAGRDTDTLSASDWMFVPLATQDAPMGVVALRFLDPARRLDPETRRLLAAVEDQIAVAVERIAVESDLERARLVSETEKLRAALLNSVSHDLRTPLVTVIGALSAVADGTLAQAGEFPDSAPGRVTDASGTRADYARRICDFVDAGALGPLRLLVNAGNGVAGVKLAGDGDEVVAALPVSCANGEAILSLAEKSWKVTEVADIPVKGRGGAGVGFHPFVGGEDALLAAAVSPTGYVRGTKVVRAEKRSKASIKGSGADVTPAG